MNFLFGIDKEAEIYCNASKISMANQMSTLSPMLDEEAENMKNMELDEHPWPEVVSAMVSWTEQNVKQSGWSLTDEDGVSWFIGLHSESLIRSGLFPGKTYEVVFKEVFKKYYSNK